MGNLKEHKVAITPDCMLNQNHAVRKIDERVYYTPYIGAYAFKVQLKNKQAELEAVNADIMAAQEKLKQLQSVIDKLAACNMEVIEENIDAPQNFKIANELIRKEKDELIKAENDPGFIQIQVQIEECAKLVKRLQDNYNTTRDSIVNHKNKIESNESQMNEIQSLVSLLKNSFKALCDSVLEVAELGINKFNEQIKTKAPATIVQNFSPLKVGLQNKKNDLGAELIKLQLNYCSKNDCDLGSGYEQIQEYINEHHKLVASDIIKYEEDLAKAKENCHLEFRESFLARLKENIENAKLEFKNLNAALKDIYYGEDSYKFELTANKKKESIYQMIASKE